MTDTADTCPADNTHPTAPVGIACAPQVFPEATPAWPQPPADGSPADRQPWRDPGTMTGAIIAAVVGGLVAAILYAWLAPTIHF